MHKLMHPKVKAVLIINIMGVLQLNTGQEK